MPDMTQTLTIETPPERAYEALTTVDGVRNWWTYDAELASEAGGTGEFSFFKRRFFARVRVAELVPPSRVVWQAIESNAPGLPGSTISFELRPEGAGTTLDFVHSDFRGTGEAFGQVTAGWQQYLASLKLYLETGSGAPHTAEER
jgi:uncharacterized protein YndB with AHSA1/START domain